MTTTRRINHGDLVAVRYGAQLRVGMIIDFDKAFTTYHIQWFDKSLPDTKCPWIVAQEYRTIFLDYRKTL